MAVGPEVRWPPVSLSASAARRCSRPFTPVAPDTSSLSALLYHTLSPMATKIFANKINDLEALGNSDEQTPVHLSTSGGRSLLSGGVAFRVARGAAGARSLALLNTLC